MQMFLKANKWNILQWPSQSPDINLIEDPVQLLKTKLKAKRSTIVVAKGRRFQGRKKMASGSN